MLNNEIICYVQYSFVFSVYMHLILKIYYKSFNKQSFVGLKQTNQIYIISNGEKIIQPPYKLAMRTGS